MLRERGDGCPNFAETDNRFHASHKRIVRRPCRSASHPGPFNKSLSSFLNNPFLLLFSIFISPPLLERIITAILITVLTTQVKEKKKNHTTALSQWRRTWKLLGLNGNTYWNHIAIYWSLALPVSLECIDLLDSTRTGFPAAGDSCCRSFQPLISDRLAPSPSIPLRPPHCSASHSLGLKVWVPRRFIGAHKTLPCADRPGQTQREI